MNTCIKISLALAALVPLVSLSVPPNDPFARFPHLKREDPTKRYKNDVTADVAVDSFHVMADIRYRFATTTMVSLVRNKWDTAQEVTFDVTLPKEAFIMNFAMTIDNKTYPGIVKEKLAAKKEYFEAKSRGQSAGHVRQAARHANLFEVSVNVASGKAVNFTLTYQELLKRQHGLYEYELHIHPGQPVLDFKVEVDIKDKQNLKYVRTPSLRTNELINNEIEETEEENDLTSIVRPTPETAKILYKPSMKDQGDTGIKGRFLVQYDVEHPPLGDLLVVDGYFVHFYSPKLPSMPKDIIFVLDLSGSMTGKKISQLKQAMLVILKDLQKKDRFNIITFSSGVRKWRPDLVSAADSEHIHEAKQFVQAMQADGMTNINLALLTAVKDFYKIEEKNRASIIFFLTDGMPTEGERKSAEITKNVKQANEKNVALISLAFGSGADYDSLKTISVQNNGFARKIYEASDADLQVSSLYGEIASVVLTNLSVSYLPSKVDEFRLTQIDFPVVYNGTEVVICGYMHETEGRFSAEINGVKDSGKIDLVFETNDITKFVIEEEETIIDITNIEEGGTKTETDIMTTIKPRNFAGLLERMWAYITIKQLIKDTERLADNEEESEPLKKKIIDLSLKYKLVTPFTSMVVVKPDEGETLSTVKAADSIDDEDEPYSQAMDPGHLSSFDPGLHGKRLTGHHYQPNAMIPQMRPVSGSFVPHRIQGSRGTNGPRSVPNYQVPNRKSRRRNSPKRKKGVIKTHSLSNQSLVPFLAQLVTTTQSTVYQTTKTTSSKPCTSMIVKCFSNPCQTAKCPASPKAECRPNYCGGCKAEFWNNNKEVTSKCHVKKDSLLAALTVESNQKQGCFVMKRFSAGRYQLLDQNGLKVDMETYCPGSKCRKVGLLNLSFEHILADKGYNTSTVINFNALNPMWERTGDFSPFKVVEKKKKLVLKYLPSHLTVTLQRMSGKKADKYLIRFQLGATTSYSGLLDAALNNKKRSRKNKKGKSKVPRLCKKLKSNVSKVLKPKDAKMYKSN